MFIIDKRPSIIVCIKDMQESIYIDTQLLSGRKPNPKIISCNGIYFC